MNWHDYFTYDPDSGLLSWKFRPRELFKTEGAFKSWNTQWSGKPLSAVNQQGYVSAFVSVIGVGHVCRTAHQVIWQMHYGPVPEGMQIDHINGVRSDNRLSNLRLATVAQNVTNRRAQRNNKSGYVGVHWCARSRRWIAKLTSRGVRHLLGRYMSAEEAGRAYLEAAPRIHREFSPHKRLAKSILNIEPSKP